MNFDENELKTNKEIELHESNFQQLFKLYDPNGTGNIKTEDFVKITQDLNRDSNFEQIVNIRYFFYKSLHFLVTNSQNNYEFSQEYLFLNKILDRKFF